MSTALTVFDPTVKFRKKIWICFLFLKKVNPVAAMQGKKKQKNKTNRNMHGALQQQFSVPLCEPFQTSIIWTPSQIIIIIRQKKAEVRVVQTLQL